uniref:Uncharacterized protein n=1 Tax=Callorhinchus milii TaxID=7868 RepID=A0A4W3GB94_CALMI
MTGCGCCGADADAVPCPQVLKETLRVYPTIPGTRRWLQRPCVIDGIHIPAPVSVITLLLLLPLRSGPPVLSRAGVCPGERLVAGCGRVQVCLCVKECCSVGEFVGVSERET